MLGKCKGPLWQRDDFSDCLIFDYFEAIIPLSICASSLCYLLLQLVNAVRHGRKHDGYHPLSQDLVTHPPPSAQDDEESADLDSDADNDESQQQPDEENITLRRITTHDSVIQVDRPRGKLFTFVLVEVAVSLELGAHIAGAVLLKGAGWASFRYIPQIALWFYISVLTSLRIILTKQTRFKFKLSRLWYHTAFIYCSLWPFVALVFRSQIIHPRNTVAWILAIVDFSLVTLLAIISLTSRKGNHDVKLEYEDNIEPSHEQTASLLALISFSWVDSLIISGYKRTLEITDVWDLAPRDKAAYVLDRYRQAKKTCTLFYHLLEYFKRELFIQAIWAMMSSSLAFAPTLLLKAILEYIENPVDIPRSTAWLYVTLLVFFGCMQAVADGQALWIGRQVSIRLRAIIIGEIYAKALRRNSVAKSDKILGTKNKTDDKRGWFQRLFGSKKSQDAPDDKNEEADPKKHDGSQVSSGAIINLMSVDSFKVSEICADLHFVAVIIPVQFFGTIFLLYRVLGYSSFVGVAIVIIFSPLNIWISNMFTRMQKDILSATDARVNITNEVLSNIRVVKFFAWEKRFMKKVEEKREREIHFLRMRYLMWSLAAMVWSIVPILNTFLSFFVYTRIEKKDLLPSVAFTSLSLFMILRVPLDQISDMLAKIMASKASVARVEEYLMEPETEKYNQLKDLKYADDGDPMIGFEKATFSWGLKGDADSFKLIDLSVNFQAGKFNLIAGATGSGKTSMLMALLGEMSLLEGNVNLPGSNSREELKPNPGTGLIESVAYCAQQAWLVNASIKENILFASEFNEKRYNDVIEACVLERDLQILDAKDETLVGEKGVALSGGQKQRISLARALYSNSRHLLLDDVLSAVDSHTAKWIFGKAILGPLMNNRSIILATHSVSLALPHADFVVVLDNGRIVARGTPQEVLKSRKLQDDVATSTVMLKNHSRAGSTAPSHGDLTTLDANGNAPEDTSGQANPAKKSKVQVQVEEKSVGNVDLSVYMTYFTAMGSWLYWIIALSSFVGGQLISVATNVWLREWSNAYARKATSVVHDSQSVGDGLLVQLPTSSFLSPNISGKLQFQSPVFDNRGTFIDRAPLGFPGISSLGSGPAQSFHFGTSPLTFSDARLRAMSSQENVDDMHYLTVYALLGVVVIFNTFFRDMIIFSGSITASKVIHTKLLGGIMRAKFRFFDSTPLGQMMNRFSKDLESIDQQLAPSAIGFFYCVLSVISVVVLISLITPGFIIAGLFISILYFLIGTLFINSSRDLKRLESVNRSPLYQQFGETLVGMTTIRAYCDERRFIRENLNRVNVQNRPFIFLKAANRWLAFRIDVLGSLISFFSGLFVVVNAGKIDPGAAGLSLSYALTYTGNILWLVRRYANNEQNMNSMERIKEYMKVEVEAEPIIEENRPPKSWPSKGSVSFINYSTRYRADFNFNLVLTKLNFKVLPGEKVGVVGRTGAGKSSMALALFRALEADEGQILVDNIDIATIGLQDLREKIVMVPQDPTLFSGTVRSNLDPFDLFTDEELFSALRKVQLIDSPGLSSTTTPNPPGTPAVGLGQPSISDGSTLGQSSMASSEGTAVGHRQPDEGLHADNKNVFQNLRSRVAESGSNLSQGQRQLLCLARALLKEPAVLVMDEATASIDHSTDAQIQETIRLLRNTTITIAHRLKTIVDYDKVLVLDRGRVVEFGEPWNLMEREDGVFAGMCKESGDADALREIARRAKTVKQSS